MTVPARRALLAFLAACVLLLGCARPPEAPPAAGPPDDPGVDELMGGRGRQTVAERIGRAGGTWDQYVAWGRELFTTGSVARPPVGPRPSPPVSRWYTCDRCHNVAREDPVLTVQDPEARLRYIAGRPGMALLQGTTFWGAVNRETFYNGYYAQYHDLCVPETTTDQPVANGGPDDAGRCRPGTRRMVATSFEDAIQVCSGYCSLGRYLVRWELDALLAYFWTLEVRLSDLGLAPHDEALVRRTLRPLSRSRRHVEEARALLAGRYLRRAGDTFRGVPAVRRRPDGTWEVGAYADGRRFTGDPARGQVIYERSCLHCHDTAVSPVAGGDLAGDVGQFFQILAKGTTQSDTWYMPEFTLERLSRQQSADVLAYLRRLRQQNR
ncbi:MAG: cytochrome c [Armatimonadota bacterium]|nr:cytochrome c [Armatimonadota bacterium]MDR7421121.1 cytochrome c [Armatimonadota bacterium]MDR7457477.1 cytochrome c [Armatimonadota bacterium]MDR7496133.1 cytochrome c [Armatimonadota bacterium]MDR7512613.1 cytochrome c [Armatimonadota bacterium]